VQVCIICGVGFASRRCLQVSSNVRPRITPHFQHLTASAQYSQWRLPESGFLRSRAEQSYSTRMKELASAMAVESRGLSLVVRQPSTLRGRSTRSGARMQFGSPEVSARNGTPSRSTAKRSVFWYRWGVCNGQTKRMPTAPPAGPNPLLEPTHYGVPPWPGLGYAVHCPSPGQVVPSPWSAQLER
jgi:hypothetical protein